MSSPLTSKKRTSYINLTRMRKAFKPKPIAVGVTSIFLAACSDNREQAMVFTSLADCINQSPEKADQCEAAYQSAVDEATRTSPKYSNIRECESEFGAQQCIPYQNGNGSGGSWFMPLMAGYMIGGMMSPRYYSSPLFTSHSRRSSLRNRWITADGRDYGDFRSRSFKVKKKAFEPKPTVNRTIKRGGFGSSVRAKSSWGSSRGGWGG